MKVPDNRIKEVLNEKKTKQTWLVEQLGKSFAKVNAYVGTTTNQVLTVMCLSMIIKWWSIMGDFITYLDLQRTLCQ